MATTFHLFPHLPWEIRSRIWELTIEPRTVDVRISYEWDDVSAEVKAKYNHSRLGLLGLRSSTPVPAPLQTCREARSHLTSVTKEGYRYYQKAFSQLPAARSAWETVRCETPEDRLELGLEAEPRYVWVDFDVDMVDTGECSFEYFESYYLDIKRWKFARDRFSRKKPYAYFDHYESYAIRKLVNAEEIHVICLGPEEVHVFCLGRGGVEDWEATHEEFCFPCDKDRLWLIDPKDGRMMNAVDNDAVCEEKRYAYYRGNGAFINPDTMQPFVPFLPPGWFEGQEEWDFLYVWDEYYDDAYPTSR